MRPIPKSWKHHFGGTHTHRQALTKAFNFDCARTNQAAVLWAAVSLSRITASA